MYAFTYQWLRQGTPIPGATASSYALRSVDAGRAIGVVVTATNSSGGASASAHASGPVAPSFAAVPSTVRRFAVNDATTASQMQLGRPEVSEVILQAWWAALQPDGPGSALDPAAVAAFVAQFAAAADAGVEVILEVSFHVTPDWVIEAVEPFTDQNGRTWRGDNAAGTRVANWIWTDLGRRYVTDFLTKLTAALTPAEMGQVTHIRIGGGSTGETQYPPYPSNAGPGSAPVNSFYAYGAAMQGGTGIAAGLSACPLPGYVPFGGQAVTAEDTRWIDWYVGGLANWLQFVNALYLDLGWTSSRLMVLHPGGGVRDNQTIDSGGYQESVAAGQDASRLLASYEGNANMWPWCTWIDSTDNIPNPAVDSDQSAWKSVYAKAVTFGKANYVRGENTSATSPETTMASVFANAMALRAPTSGYPVGTTAADWQGYKGLMWLNYEGLTGLLGAQAASMADYRAHISDLTGAGATTA